LEKFGKLIVNRLSYFAFHRGSSALHKIITHCFAFSFKTDEFGWLFIHTINAFHKVVRSIKKLLPLTLIFFSPPDEVSLICDYTKNTQK